MATYVVLGSFTQQGIQTVKDVSARVDATKEILQRLGVEMTHLWYTMGQYDVVAVFEGPDDETVAKALLTVAGAGNVRSETLRAFSQQEFQQIAATLP